ncbi:FmdB family zinc ribbon protein [Rubrobacter xylanophilus]|uniref:FmdB family zinc ribbon protein n=1 Tax=Rubrobacter xylanophilus TaxID=49319 RepID=UPI001C63E901|nr:zinc ribbon domain-containing protein [Rubrobacter xylanophilus]
MPYYEFRCATCGGFEERRSISESAEEATCPGCGQRARRIYSTFHASSVPAEVRKARRLNESGAEPRRVRRPPAETGGGSPANPRPVPGRPWQIGH